MKKLGMLSVIVVGIFLGGCSDDDKEFQLDTNRMTGVDWYYNGGASNNRLSFTDESVLDINRFDKNGEIRGIDMRVQVDTVAGVWKDEGLNTLAVEWKDGIMDKWTVTKCNSSNFVVKNTWGERKYVVKPSYLQDLTGDAFWENYFDGDEFKTRLGFRVTGNKSLRAGYVYALLSDTKAGQVELKDKNQNNIWQGNIETPVEERRVRFSCRVGSDNYVKFDERISGMNFEPLRRTDIDFSCNIVSVSNKSWKCAWKKINGENVCYKIEVYNEEKEGDVYFESYLFTYDGEYSFDGSSTSKVPNRLKDIDTRKHYQVRLTAFMLEPGVTYNSMTAENRVQATVSVACALSVQ